MDRRPWSLAERARLNVAVRCLHAPLPEVMGDMGRHKNLFLSDMVETRSAAACRSKRRRMSQEPDCTTSSRRWTKVEDVVLTDLVERHRVPGTPSDGRRGAVDWLAVAHRMNNRDVDACQRRWRRLRLRQLSDRESQSGEEGAAGTPEHFYTPLTEEHSREPRTPPAAQKWTVGEDEILIRGVYAHARRRAYGDGPEHVRQRELWAGLSDTLGGVRSAESCRKRWDALVQAFALLGAAERAEDPRSVETLLCAFRELSRDRPSAMASVKRGWSQAEHERLRDLHVLYGNVWSSYLPMFPGRTAKSIRARAKALGIR